MKTFYRFFAHSLVAAKNSAACKEHLLNTDADKNTQELFKHTHNLTLTGVRFMGGWVGGVCFKTYYKMEGVEGCFVSQEHATSFASNMTNSLSS